MKTSIALVLLTMTAFPALGSERRPVEKPKPYQLEAACASHGPGFAPLPGTRTCVRVSGRVRMEAGAERRR